MADVIRLPTTWEIRHTDPAFPGQVLIKVLGAGSTQIHVMSFERKVFLEFADQINKVANAVRLGIV